MSSPSGFYFTTPISNDRSGEAAAQHQIYRRVSGMGRPAQRTPISGVVTDRSVHPIDHNQHYKSKTPPLAGCTQK